MNSTDLHRIFRSEVKDELRPFFWSDEDIFRYMNAAYREFVRLIGGVSDFTSEACEIKIIAGEAVGEIHKSVLRIMSASARSTRAEIRIINSTDLEKIRVGDYGVFATLRLDDKEGPVQFGVIGMEKGKIRWINIPVEDDIADAIIYRTPLCDITTFDQDFTDVEDDHHIHLLDGMKKYAYLKKDADTYDPKSSDKAGIDFEAYALNVKAENERYQHKTREVAYGGL